VFGLVLGKEWAEMGGFLEEGQQRDDDELLKGVLGIVCKV
jgi:hypothetical protein